MQLYNVAKLVIGVGLATLIDATRKDSDNFVLQECGMDRKDIIPQNVLEDLINSNKFEVVRVTELLPQFVNVYKPLVINIDTSEAEKQIADLLAKLPRSITDGYTASFDRGIGRVGIIGISSPGIAKLLSELDKTLPRELSISELIDNGYLLPINVAQDTFDVEEICKAFEVPVSLVESFSVGAVANAVANSTAEHFKPLCAKHSVKLDVDGYARGGTVTADFSATVPKTTAREFVKNRLEAARQDLKQFEANLHDAMLNMDNLKHQIAEAKREVVRWEVLVKEV